MFFRHGEGKKKKNKIKRFVLEKRLTYITRNLFVIESNNFSQVRMYINYLLYYFFFFFVDFHRDNTAFEMKVPIVVEPIIR